MPTGAISRLVAPTGRHGTSANFQYEGSDTKVQSAWAEIRPADKGSTDASSGSDATLRSRGDRTQIHGACVRALGSNRPNTDVQSGEQDRRYSPRPARPKAARGGNDPAGDGADISGPREGNTYRKVEVLRPTLGWRAIAAIAKVRSRFHSGATEILPVIFGSTALPRRRSSEPALARTLASWRGLLLAHPEMTPPDDERPSTGRRIVVSQCVAPAAKRSQPLDRISPMQHGV